MQFYSGYGDRSFVDYVNTMEPEAYGHDIPREDHVHHDVPIADVPQESISESQSESQSGKGSFGKLSIKDIGMSVPMGIAANNVAGIYSKIRMGAGAIEIQFAGAGRSQRGAYTPEIMGHEQRQAIREMAAINEIKLSTHASFGVMGISGYTGDNPHGGVMFQREQRKQALDEVKRAIEFARDTAGGGSVVVHTGEVDRPISEQSWARDKYGRYIFKAYEDEPQTSRFRVVDEKEGRVTQFRKNERVSRPDWLVADKEYEGTDTHGNKVRVKKGDFIDYLDRKVPFEEIYDHENGRVPRFDKEKGIFKNKYYTFDDMTKEAQARNEWKAKMLGKKVEELSDDEKITPDEVYVRSSMEVQEAYSRGWAFYYGQSTERHIENIKKIRKALEFYNLLEKDIPVDEKWRIKKEMNLVTGLAVQFVPPESKNPTEWLKQALTEEEKQLAFSRQGSNSSLMQAEDSFERQQYQISAEKFAIREAIKSYADAGIHAMENSIDKKNPIYVSLEHIFPERYGGHLSELKKLVEGAREEMVTRLSQKHIVDPSGSRITYEEAKAMGNIALAGKLKMVDNPYYRGIPESQARKFAEEHIKATLDTGHINMWKKYWITDPNKSQEENDAAFKKWVLTEVEDLAKKKIFGNVHLVDNLGYQDEHLSPGQGNAPIKEMVDILRRHGYDKNFTVEPGADASVDNSDFHGLMKTWRLFDSPIYGMGIRTGGQSQSWGDVHYSYFGQDRPPYFVFGSYAPSNEWTLWSGMPME